MNSRNAFLLAGAAVLILLVAVILLLSGGGEDDDNGNGGGIPEPAVNNGSMVAAVEALFAGDAGPAKDLACGDADTRLDELAAELAAIPAVEGANVSYSCDVGRDAGDCQIVTDVEGQRTEQYIEFGVVEDEVCTPIEWIP